MSAPAVWRRAAAPPGGQSALAGAGVDPLLAQLLAQRGIADSAAAEGFLTPSLDALHPPALLTGLASAVERLVAARDAGQRVAIVGDYDADGVTATALLTAVLRSARLEVDTILPRRDSEGYGFQRTHVERAAGAGCRLIVTVDCGIRDTAAADAAAALGLDLIVTDHHLPGRERPVGAIVVNPRQPGCGYPFLHLAGVGLAMKLGAAFLERLGRQIPWDDLLRIACLGTIADMAPLEGENRVIAALGLKALAGARSPGLRALLDRAGVSPPVRASDVGFRIGPRLNAPGRIDSADPALELLLTRDVERAADLADLLERFNDERQRLEREVMNAIRLQLAERATLPPIVTLWGSDWHRGVVGVVAGRLSRELHRPVILLAVAGELAVGSGRSVPGLSLHQFLAPWADRFVRFGGHDAAIGLTVAVDRLAELRVAWEAAAAREWPADALTPHLDYHLEVEPDALDDRLEATLERLAPYGPGNPEPLLRVGPWRAAEPPRVFGSGHLGVRGQGRSGVELELIGWGWGSRQVEWEEPFEVLAYLDRDRLRGGRVLRMVDVRAVEHSAP